MSLADNLTAKWQPVLDASRDIWSWTEPHALAYCCEQASKASFAVELGTYLGKSAIVMLMANPRLHLWCVDTFNEIGIQKTAEYWLKDYIWNGRCEIIKGDSALAASMLPHMKGTLDACFVDDGHAESDVIRDIRSIAPLMKPGSTMWGHDFDVPHNDVARGVLSVIPQGQIQIPVPRVWAWTVQELKKQCCGK